MKKKSLILSLLTGFLVIALFTPTTSSAFWPFDQIFQKGEVKGETTDKSVKKQNVIQKIFQSNNTPETPTITPALTEDEILNRESTLNDKKLKDAVMGRRISAAQLKLIQQKLALIKAKRDELKKLQQEFQAWLKANKINPKDFMDVSDVNPTATPKREDVQQTTPKPVVTSTVNTEQQ